MRFTVTFELDDDDGDPSDETGLTEAQYEALMGSPPRLPSGAYDIELECLERP
jgi:hypothetical protein